MQAWLNAEKHDRESVAHGAEMVLKLTRNMSMYQTIMRRPERFESRCATSFRSSCLCASRT